MKIFQLICFAIISFLSVGCATRLYNPETGKPLAVFTGDADSMQLVGGGMTLSMTGMNHSRASAVNWRGASNFVSATGLALAPFVVPAGDVSAIVPPVVNAATMFRPQPVRLDGTTTYLAPGR